MDPITHAASGALAALSVHRPKTVWAVPLAALVAAAPDADVFVAHTPLEFLLLHRGITHSLFAAPVMGLILGLCMYPWWRKNTPGAWSFPKTCAFAMLLVLLHIWLDVITTYGTMIFLPFSEYRARLNGVFIVDVLLTLPLLLGVWFGRKNRSVAIAALIWTLIYPAACVGLRMRHETATAERLAAASVPAAQLTVLPDAFAPFFWRALYVTQTPYSPPETMLTREGFAFHAAASTVWQEGLDWRGLPHAPVQRYPAADSALMRGLAQASHEGDAFFRFTLMPLQEKRAVPHAVPPSSTPGAPHMTAGYATQEYRFYDLRFGTMLEPVRQIMALRQHGDIPFQLLSQRQGEDWTAVRMIFSGADRENPWHAPEPPRAPTWWEWLVGLH